MIVPGPSSPLASCLINSEAAFQPWMLTHPPCWAACPPGPSSAPEAGETAVVTTSKTVRAVPQRDGRLAEQRPHGSKLWGHLHNFCVFAVAFAMVQSTVFICAGWWECENGAGCSGGQKREQNQEYLRFIFSWLWQCSPQVLQQNFSIWDWIPETLGISVQNSSQYCQSQTKVWILTRFELNNIALRLWATLVRKIILKRFRPLLHWKKFDGNLYFQLL